MMAPNSLFNLCCVGSGSGCVPPEALRAVFVVKERLNVSGDGRGADHDWMRLARDGAGCL